MHSRWRTFLICFVMAAMMFSSAVLAEDSTPTVVQARIASVEVLVNGQNIDQQNSLYPLLEYKDITYFPLTWNYGQALGFQVDLDAETGLSIVHSAAVSDLIQDLLPEGSEPQLLGNAVAAILPIFPINLMGEATDPQSEWPYLIYNDITYIPFTWENAVDHLKLSYTFDSATSTLSIDATTVQDEPPVTKPAVDESEPSIITGQAPLVVTPKIESLLKNGHPITVAEIAKIQALNTTNTQQSLPQQLAFDATFAIESSDMTMQQLGGTVSGAFDLEAMRFYLEFALDEQASLNPMFASVKPLQVLMRLNPQNPEELQIIGHLIDEPWEAAPLELSLPAEQLNLFKSLTSGNELDIEEIAAAFEEMGLGPIADLMRGPEDTTLLMNIFSLFEYEEATIDGRDIIRIGYTGSVGAIYEAMNLDPKDFMGQLMGNDNLAANPLYAEFSPEELAEFQELMEQQMQQSIDQAMKMNIALAMSFDTATSLPVQYSYSFAVPSMFENTDPIIVEMACDYSYGEDNSTLEGFDIVISTGNAEEYLNIAAAFELDYDFDFDWDALDEAIAVDIP